MTERTFSQTSIDIEKAAHVYAELRRIRPSTKRDRLRITPYKV